MISSPVLVLCVGSFLTAYSTCCLLQPDLANIPAAMKFVDSSIVMGDFASILYLCLPIGGAAGRQWDGSEGALRP